MDMEEVQGQIEAARQCAMVLAASARLPVSSRDAAKIAQQLQRHLERALAAVQPASLQRGAA